MRSFIITLGIILSSLFIQAQSKISCANIHTGKFYIKSDGTTTRITRTKDKQVEEQGDIKITLAVEWIDDCTYKLKFLKGNKAWEKHDGKGGNNPDLIVKITSVDDEGYEQEAVFVGIESLPPYKNKVYIDK